MAEVNLNNLKPNSNRYKETQKENGSKKERLDSVINGSNSVISTKPSFMKKLKKNLLQKDGKDIKDIILWDMIIPGIRDGFFNVLTMICYNEPIYRGGGSYGGSYRYGGSRYGRNSYDTMYRSRDSRTRRDYDSRRDSDYDRESEKVDYRYIILRYRDDAQKVVYKMRERIEEYGSASVADLFDLIGVSGEFIDNDWGWTNIDQIGLKRVSSGYLIDVPEARYLN